MQLDSLSLRLRRTTRTDSQQKDEMIFIASNYSNMRNHNLSLNPMEKDDKANAGHITFSCLTALNIMNSYFLGSLQ